MYLLVVVGLIACQAADDDHALQAAEENQDTALTEQLEQAFGGQPDQISETPMEGVLEVTYGAQVFYVSEDGRHLISGEMFELATRNNLTEKRISEVRHKLMEQVAESDMIVYKAKGEEKHVISVFTDIDCGYCRKLHKGMDEMNELGITVRYLAFPRAGVNSPSYNKAVSVWCAEDRNTAMDDAKNRDKISGNSCEDAPVKEHYALGQSLGVRGTPAIVLSDGTLQPGYLPPKRLAQVLDKQGNQ
ncbi:MAG: bifunctional protein-disulfide isomerase/oxidoreductase DsbC [Pseudomonadota bacterium]